MKNVWVFTSNNARMVKVHDHVLKDFMDANPTALLDPDLSKVKHVPLHLWKNVGGLIEPMTAGEAKIREEHLLRFGADNNVFYNISERGSFPATQSPSDVHRAIVLDVKTSIKRYLYSLYIRTVLWVRGVVWRVL
jgi:hypothetical protein